MWGLIYATRTKRDQAPAASQAEDVRPALWTMCACAEEEWVGGGANADQGGQK